VKLIFGTAAMFLRLAITRIWLGDKPVQAGLKKAMLGV